MPDQSKENPGKSASWDRPTPMELRPAAHVVEVRHLDTPPPVKRPKMIHARRLPPFVREGMERGTHSLDRRANIAREAGNDGLDIQVVVNTKLTQPGANHVAGNVGEPSVSVNGDVVFLTGNWYAAVSVDGGLSFKFIDPNGMAQPSDPAGVTFCCDQVVNYLPSIDTFVWLLQYGPAPGDKIQRLALATTPHRTAGRGGPFQVTTAAVEDPGFCM